VAVDPEPGEQVYFHGHPSWRSILSFYLKGLVLTILAGAIAGGITRLTGKTVDILVVVLVVLILFVLVLIAGFLMRLRTTYTITNRRLTINIGILSREQHETRLERVQNVNTNQSLLERMLRVGTVDFDTAAEAGFEFSFRGVSNPREIVRTVDRAIHAFQERQQPDPQQESGV
jgi:uncharacterized membrane protein YdbT with pleckstrin-like domain